MVSSEKHQKSLLGGIERLAGVEYPELVLAIPKILMAFYQMDILEEEVIKQWGTHVSKKFVDKETSKKVRKASEPFLKVRSSYLQMLWTNINIPLRFSGSMKRRMTKRTTSRLSCPVMCLTVSLS